MINFNRLFSIIIVCLSVSVNSADAQRSESAHHTFIELPDPTADTLADWSGVRKGLQASFATIDKRFAKSLVPKIEITKTAKIQGWKGERVSAQVLLWTASEVPQVGVSISDFKSKTGENLSSAIASARFVRYVMTDEYFGLGGNPCGPRNAEDYASSLSADMLDNLNRFDLETQKARPVWITIDIPRDAIADSYTTEITIKGKKSKSVSLSLELEVIDQILPEPASWGFHLDQWQHPSAIARVEGLEVWSDAHFEAMKPVMQLLANAGQKVITTTLNKDPWNVQTFDPYADMIIWTKRTDGSWTYDYTVFDRWVEFMMGLGIKKMINCYSIVPWNNEIHYKDETTGKVVNIKADPGTPVFKEMWGSFLKDFSDHLQQRGWLEITNIALDERDRESMDAAFRLVDSVAPKLGVAFADNQKTYRRYPNSKDISISSENPFEPKDLIDRKNRGLNTTFYIYCRTKFPNQFTFSDPAESAYLGWYTKAHNFNGVLRWAFNSWVEHPMQDSRFRTWSAGDTYIVYPGGRSSIRYERMLEGIQDYEKIRIVQEKLVQRNDQASLLELDEAIKKQSRRERTDGWNEDLNQAKRLLNGLAVTLVEKKPATENSDRR